MKKLLFILSLIVCSVFALTSCDDDFTYNIVVTNFPGYDAARAVTKGTNKSIKMLLTPGSDAHSFDPSASDIAACLKCEVFVYVGGESDEEWVENNILANVTENTKVVSMFDVLEGSLYEEEDHEEENHENHEEEYDEHVWTDPTNFVKIVEAVKNALVTIDNDNKDKYEKNYEEYKNELLKLDEEMKAVVEFANKDTIVLADRNPFLYFEKHYGVEVVGAFPGCGTVEAISAQKKTKLIDAIKTNNLDTVFILETTDENNSAGMDIVNEINSQINSGKYNGNVVEIKTLYAMENPSKADFGNGKTYIDMFNHNIGVISFALNTIKE